MLVDYISLRFLASEQLEDGKFCIRHKGSSANSKVCQLCFKMSPLQGKVLSAAFLHTVLLPLLGQDCGQHPILKMFTSLSCTFTYIQLKKKVT